MSEIPVQPKMMKLCLKCVSCTSGDTICIINIRIIINAAGAPASYIAKGEEHRCWNIKHTLTDVHCIQVPSVRVCNMVTGATTDIIIPRHIWHVSCPPAEIQTSLNPSWYYIYPSDLNIPTKYQSQHYFHLSTSCKIIMLQCHIVWYVVISHAIIL